MQGNSYQSITSLNENFSLRVYVHVNKEERVLLFMNHGFVDCEGCTCRQGHL